ncbi:MAG: hypothetical protein SGI84_03060 [Gemmatimonadota bacterium]|nr:hypothetical protein [Gemmatimonadota bacterium]
MKLLDAEETVVLVVGGTATAEERDRPLAERIKVEIDRRGDGHAWRRAVIVNDQQYFGAEGLQRSTVIAIGGPGSNAAAAHFVDRLDTLLAQDDRFWVQASLEVEPRRVALWGINSAATGESVTAFIEHGYLEDLLGRIWRVRPGMMM